MKETIIHIHNGKIVEQKGLRDLFMNLKNGKHLVTIKDFRRRSLPQNAYYWGVVVPMVRKALYEIGFDDVQTDQDAHELIKKEFVRKEFVNKQTGEMISITGSTAGLSVTEFGEYLEKICRWAAEYLGVVIPSPNEELAHFNDWENHVSNVSE